MKWRTDITEPLSVWFTGVSDPVVAWFRHHLHSEVGKIPPGRRRSSQWPAVRREHLQRHPKCACCGGTRKLEVHHIEPFHVAPEKELDPDNLMTLCEAKKFGIHCHLLCGHLGNWRRWNPLVKLHATQWRLRLTGRCFGILEAFERWWKQRAQLEEQRAREEQ